MTKKQPQLEDGFVRIVSELVDQFCRRNFNGAEWRVLWAVIRKTYGFNKREDVIAYSQFVKLTGLHHRAVGRTLKALKLKNVLIVTEARVGNSYRLNKNYSDWIVADLLLPETKENQPEKLSTGSNSASGKIVGGVVAPHAGMVVAPLCVKGGSSSGTHNRQKTIDNTVFQVSELKKEIETLSKIGWDGQKIKGHLINTRGISESDVDKAMGKEF